MGQICGRSRGWKLQDRAGQYRRRRRAPYCGLGSRADRLDKRCWCGWGAGVGMGGQLRDGWGDGGLCRGREGRLACGCMADRGPETGEAAGACGGVMEEGEAGGG